MPHVRPTQTRRRRNRKNFNSATYGGTNTIAASLPQLRFEFPVKLAGAAQEFPPLRAQLVKVHMRRGKQFFVLFIGIGKELSCRVVHTSTTRAKFPSSDPTPKPCQAVEKLWNTIITRLSKFKQF